MPGDEGFFLDSDDKAAERVGVDNFLEGGQELGGSWVCRIRIFSTGLLVFGGGLPVIPDCIMK